MDAASLRETVADEKSTELDRLGSSKLLLALTDAELDAPSVLRAAADSEHAARNTFRAWADDESADDARRAFAAVADQEQEHLDRVTARLDEDYDPADGGPLHTYLRGLDDTIARIGGGLLGRPLVSLRTHTQLVGFFVNDVDESTADLFRDLRDETEAELQRGLDLLDAHCTSDDDWDVARGTATYAIQVAYDDYADALLDMGMDPKPLC